MIQTDFSAFVSCIGMIVSYSSIHSKSIGLKGKRKIFSWDCSANDTKEMDTFCTTFQYYKIRQIVP